MEPSDEQLMRRYVEQGDAVAFEALFGRYAPRLHRYFRRHVRQPALAEELVQQTFLHVHRARRDFRLDARFRPWLFTIAANLQREHWRWRSRRPETPLGPDGPVQHVDPQTSTATDRLVRRTLDGLPEAEREVVLLHWFEELSFREIAEVVGASYSAVKVRAHRAYNKLRTQLGGEGEWDQTT